MHLAERPQRLAEHHNAFGFLRLFFASLVIASHVPELVDGGGRRELLTRLTGATSLGGVAVYGFFVISGYLITGSSLSSTSRLSYLRKRMLRIYPAFAVCSGVCVFVVAPLFGSTVPVYTPHSLASYVGHAAILARPTSDGPFADQYGAGRPDALDGALWTIQYEFLCYLLVLPLAWIAPRLRLPVVAGMAALFLAAGAVVDRAGLAWHPLPYLFPVSGAANFNLVGIFFAGATYRIARARVTFSRPWIVAAAIVFVLSLFSTLTAAIGYAVCGAYLILWFGKAAGQSWVARVNNKDDISYGVYLYAWPLERIFMSFGFGRSLILLGLCTWGASIACGMLSWRLIEKPVMRAARSGWTGLRLRQRSPEQGSTRLE